MDTGQKPDPGPPPDKLASFEYLPGVHYNGYRVMVVKDEICPHELCDTLKSKVGDGLINQIIKLGKKSAVIHCKSLASANKIATDLSMVEAGYKLFIPLYYVASCALIFEIPTKYSEAEIMERMNSGQFKPLKVERVKRKEFNSGIVETHDTRRMKVYFHGTFVPRYVLINHVYIRCEPFVQRIQQCRKCWRVGHYKNICREIDNKCSGCWGSHLLSDCTEEIPNCILCRGNHPSNDPKCPEMERQRNIRIAMSSQNLCRNEAALIYPRPRKNVHTFRQVLLSNPFEVLNQQEDFPPLQTKHPKKTPSLPLDIPAHDKPSTISSVPTQRNQVRVANTNAKGTKRINKDQEEEQLIEEAIRRAQKERKLLETSNSNTESPAPSTSKTTQSNQLNKSPNTINLHTEPQEATNRMQKANIVLENVRRILEKENADTAANKPPNILSDQENTENMDTFT